MLNSFASRLAVRWPETYGATPRACMSLGRHPEEELAAALILVIPTTRYCFTSSVCYWRSSTSLQALSMRPAFFRLLFAKLL